MTLMYIKSTFPLLQCCTTAQRDHEHLGKLYTKDARSENAARKSEPGYQLYCYTWLQNHYSSINIATKREPCT